MIKRFREEFAFLSNFAPCKINFMGRVFPSTENAYAAAKCKYEEDIDQFTTISSGQAKRLGRRVANREDWDSVKLKIMEELLVQKFNQEPFKQKLIDTGDQEILEGNSWGDKFWGVDEKTLIGENNLGKLLMKIRENIK